jgi:Holliday junction DNA helicase RuvA
MIGRLTGTLYEKMPPRIGLDVQGVGYEIDVSMTTFYALPELGAQVTILTHLTVREDAHILFGFSSAQERAAFRELVKVSGIGARTALAVLSGMSVADLAQAITLQEPARLTRIPGIGTKTAQRLLLEMKGKLGADLGASPSVSAGNQTDVLHALTALGYSERESLTALKTLPDGVSVSDGIRLALKSLSR